MRGDGDVRRSQLQFKFLVLDLKVLRVELSEGALGFQESPLKVFVMHRLQLLSLGLVLLLAVSLHLLHGLLCLLPEIYLEISSVLAVLLEDRPVTVELSIALLQHLVQVRDLVLLLLDFAFRL